VLSFAKSSGVGLRGLIKSPLLGPKGNAEFLVWYDFGADGLSPEELVAGVIEEAS
jgi:23S rRNA (cytidine1920-2'-O)/16S rRNA (cytidine1409-2'-O)-methyltransferase